MSVVSCGKCHNFEDASARVIQRAWRAHGQRIPSNGPLKDWLSAYATDFIAHATRAVNEIIQSGMVKPAEAVLRDSGKVETEQGRLGDRFLYLLPEIGEFRQRCPNFQPRPSIVYQIRSQRFIDEDEKGNPVSVICSTIHYTSVDINDPVRFLVQTQNIKESAAKIFYDMLQPSEQSVYKILSRAYSESLNAGLQPQSIREKTVEIRNMVLPRSITQEIRAQSNGIHWGYGDVVILRGKGKSITSEKIGNEALLLSPWENRGEFFCLPLDEEATIILGPREPIEKFRQKGFHNTYSYEELAPQERRFFKIPWKWEPKIKQIRAYLSQAAQSDCPRI